MSLRAPMITDDFESEFQTASNSRIRDAFKEFGVLNVLPAKTILNDDSDEIFLLLEGEAYSYCQFKLGRRQINQIMFSNSLIPIMNYSQNNNFVKLTTQSWIYSLNFNSFMKLMQSDEFCKGYISSLVKMNCDLRHLAILIGRKRAQESVAGLILFLFKKTGFNDSFELHLSRKEMGELLGLTFETVSREISFLRKIRTIEVYKYHYFKIANNQKLLQVYYGNA